MQMTRSFLAIPLVNPLKKGIVTLQKELAGRTPDVRWVRPDNLHLTLRFFGDVTQEDLEKIKVSMLSVKCDLNAFTIAVKGLGAFPNLQRASVIWLGLEPAHLLKSLYQRCQTALGCQGIATEQRPFTPHLTIGRLRRKNCNLYRLAEAYQDRQFGLLPVKELILYESRLHRDRAEHRPIYTVELAAQAGMEHNPESIDNDTSLEGTDYDTI